ncbi:MAG: helix-turn-helix transcriptional regulator [bacterium]|nr:helix-turn-helix transcriptional regulator [bacterium]
MEFDKKILMNNISYLLKRKNKRIGDLESEIGVSKGYISRINKKSNGVAAGIDIVYKIAQALEVSVDVLISVDLQIVDDKEIYLLNLLKSFQKKTENREIFWNKHEPRSIASMLAGKEYTNIPMLHTHPDDRNERFDDYEYISRKIYVSSFLGTGLDLGDDNNRVGPWFTLEIDDLNTVYLTDVMKYSHKGESSEVLEMYIYTSEYYEEYDEDGSGSSGYTHSLVPLCCSAKMGENIDAAMTALYKTVCNHQNDIHIPVNLKEVLDKFMKS